MEAVKELEKSPRKKRGKRPRVLETKEMTLPPCPSEPFSTPKEILEPENISKIPSSELNSIKEDSKEFDTLPETQEDALTFTNSIETPVSNSELLESNPVLDICHSPLELNPDDCNTHSTPVEVDQDPPPDETVTDIDCQKDSEAKGGENEALDEPSVDNVTGQINSAPILTIDSVETPQEQNEEIPQTLINEESDKESCHSLPTESVSQETTGEVKVDELPTTLNMDIPSWENENQFHASLNLSEEKVSTSQPPETDVLKISSSASVPDIFISPPLEVPPSVRDSGHITSIIPPTVSESGQKLYQRPSTPHIPSDPPSSQARRRVLNEPELKEFLSVPPFHTQFKSCYKPMTSTIDDNSRKSRMSSRGQQEKVPLDVSWKELSTQLGFECLDTTQDEAIAFYTMILWDDLLPPRPMLPSCHVPVDPRPVVTSQSPAKDHVRDFMGETKFPHPLESGHLTLHPPHPRHHHYNFAHQGRAYGSRNTHFVYGNQGHVYPPWHQPERRGHKFPGPFDPSHPQQLANCGFQTNHPQIDSRCQTPNFKSTGHPPPPRRLTPTPSWLGKVGGKTKRLLVNTFTKSKAKQETGNEVEGTGHQDVRQGSFKENLEDAGVVNSTEELLIAQALLLSQQEEQHGNLTVDQNISGEVVEPVKKSSKLNSRVESDPPKKRGIFSFRRKDRKKQD